MPTEHEFKHVLSLDLLKDTPENVLEKTCDEYRSIEQGVICHGPSRNLRIRKSVYENRTEWTMTFKLKHAERTIEIENVLDKRDGEDLWKNVYWELTKNRYVFKKDKIDWEVDLFKRGDEVYFILVECELPEGQPRPKKMPSFLRKHLLYKVPLTDDRFSNKRLGNFDYAQFVYSEVVKSRKDK